MKKGKENSNFLTLTTGGSSIIDSYNMVLNMANLY